jgi:predicted helicase
MNFQKILTKYREISISEADKGRRFEKLMGAYLKTTPLYSSILHKVWLWSDFPHKQQFSGKDVGIDLVAMTTDGEFWAVQCKCVDDATYINKPAVDSFLATSSRKFKDEEGKTHKFALRLWFSTTNKWSLEAENALKNQDPEVKRQNLYDLETAAVDWDELDQGLSGKKARLEKKVIRPHQQDALDKFHSAFKEVDRGKLIMACGTGKTLTALKLAEQEVGKGGLVLFLAPSIALIGQTLKEWMEQASLHISPICVCSDPQVSKKKISSGTEDEDSFSVVDLALPASTDVSKISKQMEFSLQRQSGTSMTVVFSTYQSIDVVKDALKKIKKVKQDFDLIICDEAHRTTGVTLKGEKDADFVKIHDQDFIQGRKRVYMTATPRLYRDAVKEKAKEIDAYLCSMDDVAMYGPEVYRLGFGAAVDRQLLTDYKVLILTILESQIPSSLQKDVNSQTKEINTDDACKLMGCINALSKRMVSDDGLLMATDPGPMHRAVAFCQSIKKSKDITASFNDSKESYYQSLVPEVQAALVDIQSDHIDGTMGASRRDEKLSWLKAAPTDGKECRILTNVKCLSEGVDVPNLDAVIFISSKNSQIDVVQSVGRVMRKAPGKKYGYIIIPVTITSDGEAEALLGTHDAYKVVWTVLNALRAHDDRFEAQINKLALNKKREFTGGGVKHGGIPTGDGSGESVPGVSQIQLPFPEFEQLQNVIYAKMVQKVGKKDYWEKWAEDVARIAQSYIGRISRLIAKPGPHKDAFDKFLADLRKNINPAVEAGEVVEMLAQHLITKPVFESLFENYSFVQSNPVSQALQTMVDILNDQALEKDTEGLEGFYKSVTEKVSDIDNAEARQTIIVELYEKFFKTAFPKTVERLGIVYTPVEVVDFINFSVAAVLEKEFGRSLADENVHILDPFTGTGTFITRLIQSGIIPPASLARKYDRELHANEIVLLAYYIASINIENAFHAVQGEKSAYKPFNGICLTDTFQLGETDKADSLFAPLLPHNSKRVQAQKKTPIRVIIGNPPYSVGQRSANDMAQNQSYPKLEKRIAETYAAGTKATNKNSLYDSYIKAFRWASDRLDVQHGGLIAFVSNAGWIDGNAMDGLRKCLENEFSSIYVFNLRGNQRTSGELSRKEGGKIFGSGSRTPVAITVLVKKAGHKGKAVIRYNDIGDYLTREEKLAIVAKKQHALYQDMKWTKLQPNEHGDWLNQRNDQFDKFIPLGDKDDKNNKRTVFVPYYSRGLETTRDAWAYNSSTSVLSENMKKTISVYNSEVDRYAAVALNFKKNIDVESFVTRDEKQISWSSSLMPLVERQIKTKFEPKKIRAGLYRPFFKQKLYFDEIMNHRTGQWFKLFPTPEHDNLVICATGIGATKDFSVFITDVIPDIQLQFNGQCFPLYCYDPPQDHKKTLFDLDHDNFTRRDGVTDFILDEARALYGTKTTKEDVFYYVYGLLHSPDYCSAFANDLKKMLPRLSLVEKAADFKAFSKAGRDLAELHLSYEGQPPPSKVKVIGADSGQFQVEKMRFPDKTDKSVIIFNPWIKITNIPLEAYDYVINGRSAIEWIMERYEVKTDKASGIKNDPNDWAKQHEKPRYILDLLLSVITVSLETLKIVKSLPSITFQEKE